MQQPPPHQAPYNPYGQPPGRPAMGQQPQPQGQPQGQPQPRGAPMQAPLSGSNAFRPFNPAMQQGPMSSDGRMGGGIGAGMNARGPPMMRGPGPARPMSGPLSGGARLGGAAPAPGAMAPVGMAAPGARSMPGAPMFGAAPRGMMGNNMPGQQQQQQQPPLQQLQQQPPQQQQPPPMGGFPGAMMRGPPTGPPSGPPSGRSIPTPGGFPPSQGFQPRGAPSGPPAPMAGPPPPNGAMEPRGQSMPMSMPMRPPPANANALQQPSADMTSQFGQMRLGGPPMAGAAPGVAGPPRGQPFGMRGPAPPGPPTGPPTGPMAGPPTGPPMGASMPAPPMGPPMGGAGVRGPPMMGNQTSQMSLPPMQQQYGAPPMNGAMGGPMGSGPAQPPNALPTGNFQQSTDMMDGYGHTAGQSSVLSDELMASQCDPRFMRMTMSMCPYSRDHATKSGLTVGVITRPMAPPPDGKELPVVNFGPTGVVRCRHCRTYINPFVQWVDNGRRWRCNICGVSNDVASSYFCHLNANGQRQDRDEHPELSCGSYEIVAPSEYMMRPPQPPCFMFVIDVSAQSMASGAMQIAIQTIKDQLDNLPGAPRTRVGFLTYDHTIHFYNLKSTLKTPQMMVIADLDELFIPIPDELLVNLSDSREVIDALLDTLPTIHQNAISSETALGPAIRVAFKLMSSIGGKMLVFQSSLPSTGVGALQNRENPRLIGSDKEHTLLSMATTFYRSNAIDCCRQQISVDTFLFSPTYTDVATLSTLSRFSAGQLYYYPAFTVARDGEKFSKELAHCLTRETGWEAVLRVRSTKGTRMTNFYGSHFLRGPDLMATPTINSDATFAIEITHSDTLFSSSTFTVQGAVMYTNSAGERRLRVHTLCVPVTKLYAEIFRSADVDALCNIMAKNALEMALKTGLESARSHLQKQCVEIVRSYRNSGAAAQNQNYQSQLPESLQLLPLYIMSLLKNPAFRGGTDLSADERAYYQYRLYNMPTSMSRVCIYPRMFGLHTLPPEAGLPAPEDENRPEGEPLPPTAGSQRIVLPPLVNLSIERLMCDGVFLLEDATTFFLWIGRSVPEALLSSLFGLPSLDGVDTKQLHLQAPHDDFSQRVHNILTAIREDRLPWMEVAIMRDSDPSEGRFFWKLVEDRASFPGGSYSYQEYLNQIMRLSLAGQQGR